MRLLCIVLLIVFIPLALHAAFDATYDPEPVLFFEPGTAPLSTNKLVAKLGTLKIYRDSGPLHYPTLMATTTLSHEFWFTGPISPGGGGSNYQTDTVLFYLYAVSTTKQGKVAIPLNDSQGNHPLYTGRGNVNVNPFVVDLYLVSHLDLSWFKLGSLYTLSNGELGGFQVGASAGGSGYNPGTDPYIPVNNDPAEIPTPTPILPPGVSPEDPDPIIYGDPSDIVDCTFSIINEQSFELYQAYGNQSAVVATAQINLFNVAPNETYGVTLTFTNATDTYPFLMRLQGTMTNPPTIEYKLLFNNILIDPGDSVSWENLTDGTFSKDISVTGINPTAVQTRLSGSYSDTVYVTIVPIDSQ